MTTRNGRTADHRIEPLFLERWSPRGFADGAMTDDELHRLFEAARWAPSSSNLQPWRFLYAKRDSDDWALFFDPLNDGNKTWAASAAVLVAVLSKRTAPTKTGDGIRENESHSFDTGAAWACLALQAAGMGWATHAMGGFDRPRAAADLGIPDDYRIECMVAVGRPLSLASPTPKTRAPQTSFVRAGPFAR